MGRWLGRTYRRIHLFPLVSRPEYSRDKSISRLLMPWFIVFTANSSHAIHYVEWIGPCLPFINDISANSCCVANGPLCYACTYENICIWHLTSHTAWALRQLTNHNYSIYYEFMLKGVRCRCLCWNSTMGTVWLVQILVIESNWSCV